MSPLSAKQEARDRQLANLKRGGDNPAGPGNARAVSHGAYAAVAQRDLEEKAREIYEALASDAPVREGDGSLPAADALAVQMLATVVCRRERIAEYIERRGWEDETGKPRPVLEYDSRLEGNQIALLKELGMTPAARAKLGLDLVRSAAVAEEVEATREARERLDDRVADLDGDAEEER